MGNNDFYYSFYNTKTGISIISQSWNDFYNLQENRDLRCKKLGLIEYIPSIKGDNSHKVAERNNNFWKGALGYEKVGHLDAAGIPASGIYNGIRNFIKTVHNMSCMEGDEKTLKLTQEADKWFWHNSRIHQFALPEAK